MLIQRTGDRRQTTGGVVGELPRDLPRRREPLQQGTTGDRRRVVLIRRAQRLAGACTVGVAATHRAETPGGVGVGRQRYRRPPSHDTLDGRNPSSIAGAGVVDLETPTTRLLNRRRAGCGSPGFGFGDPGEEPVVIERKGRLGLFLGCVACLEQDPRSVLALLPHRLRGRCPRQRHRGTVEGEAASVVDTGRSELHRPVRCRRVDARVHRCEHLGRAACGDQHEGTVLGAVIKQLCSGFARGEQCVRPAWSERPGRRGRSVERGERAPHSRQRVGGVSLHQRHLTRQQRHLGRPDRGHGEVRAECIVDELDLPRPRAHLRRRSRVGEARIQLDQGRRLDRRLRHRSACGVFLRRCVPQKRR